MMKRDKGEKKRLVEKTKEEKARKEVDYENLHGKTDEYGEAINSQNELPRELSEEDKKFLEEMKEKMLKNKEKSKK